MIREYQNKDWPEVEILYGKMLEELYPGDVAQYPKALFSGLFDPLRPEHVEFGMVCRGKTGRLEGFIVGHKHSEDIFRISNMYVEPNQRGTPTPVIMYNIFRRTLKARFGIKHLIAGVSSRQKNINEILDGLGFVDFEIYKFKELS